jgi:hypothetical protein
VLPGMGGRPSSLGRKLVSSSSSSSSCRSSSGSQAGSNSSKQELGWAGQRASSKHLGVVDRSCCVRWAVGWAARSVAAASSAQAQQLRGQVPAVPTAGEAINQASCWLVPMHSAEPVTRLACRPSSSSSSSRGAWHHCKHHLQQQQAASRRGASVATCTRSSGSSSSSSSCRRV